jgi:hypothetical protein
MTMAPKWNSQHGPSELLLPLSSSGGGLFGRPETHMSFGALLILGSEDLAWGRTGPALGLIFKRSE